MSSIDMENLSIHAEQLEGTMNFFQAVLIGILHGITACLPVSSSGHAGLVGNLWNIGAMEGLFYEVLLHTATLFAIVAAFWKDVRKISAEFVLIIMDVLTNIRIFIENKKTGSEKRYQKITGTNYRKMSLMLMVAVIPMAILGFLSRHLVEIAFGSLPAIGIGMMISAILLLVMDYMATGNKIPRNMTFDNAMWIGICQGISVFPGISRIGVSMSVGLLCGLNKKAAVKFTFLTAIPAVSGGMILEFGKIGKLSLSGMQLFSYLSGAVVAGILGFLLVRRMARYLMRAKFRGFACYSFLLGIVAIVCNFLR